MRHFFLRSPQSLISSIALWTSFIQFLSSDFCYTQNSEVTTLESSDAPLGNQDEPKYTINFNHVPVVEVIRFVSKITKSNFVFEENDLGFSVTIVSEEPISVQNVMSALIQVLRVHDLRLLEQDGNLLITKSTTVNQVSTLILPNSPQSLHTQAPIVTRVFRVKNANPDSVASIIRPMVSGSSLIEVSAETRQIIVTDILTNIDKIASLLISLDTPNTRLEIESYSVKNITPAEVVTLTQQLLSPFMEGNPLILVPQPERNIIFIVSTPYLIERALTVMEDLDVPPQNMLAGETKEELHVYRILNTTSDDILNNLQNISTQIEEHASDKSSFLLKALKSVKYIPDTGSLTFIANATTWAKVQEILTGIDVPSGISEKSSFWIYQVQNVPLEQFEASLRQLTQNVQNYDLSASIQNMKVMKDSNSIVFNGSQDVLDKLQQIVPTLDASSQKAQTYFLFKVEHGSESTIRSALMKLAENISNPGLKQTIENMKWIEESHSFVFNGPPEAITELQSILPVLDVAPSNAGQRSYIYQIQNATKTEIIGALKKMADGLEDKDLATAMQNVKWIEENNSLLFNGSPSTLAKLQAILPTLDFQTNAAAKTHFIVYSPLHQKGEILYKDLKKLHSDLQESGLENSDFLNALNSVKWTPSTNSLVFTGDPASVNRIQTILADLDKDTETAQQVFLYSPQNVSPNDLKDSLDRLAKGSDQTDPANLSLIKTIQTAQWIPESNSYLFKSDQATLDHLKQIIATIDNPNSTNASTAQNFYLYKLQNAPGNLVIQNLKNLADNISSDDLRNAAMIKGIRGLKWVKENNSILITASPQTIEVIKGFISEFDIAPENGGSSGKTEFFIYKPTTQSPEQIQTSLSEFATDLEKSGLNDPDFLHTLKSARLVPASKSLVFTGTNDSLAKLKAFLNTLDATGNPIPIQTVGTTTFLIYKIQNSSATELMNALQTFSKQLSKADVQDKTLAACLDSVKWIKETNSLLFTGTEDTLRKVEKLIEKFDVTSLASTSRAATSTFFVYNPKYQSGTELIHIFDEFKQNLEHTGVSDPGLFDSITHLKFIEKTNSLIISGDRDSIEKIKALLEKFDIPGQESNQAPLISTIDETNFLIYKLQYHKGLEIQAALKKVAASLSKTEKATSKILVECIDSLQWIEVTNSLLGTGEAAILEKVKGLIHNLDVPLKQVFIEVLVIETTLSNSQTLGLQWGSQLQYMNKTIGAMGNFPGTPNNILQSPLTLTTADNSPAQGGTSTTSVPFTQGFDLGMIGDIIFHKGKSFLSLGSLLTALQIDSDSTIVMNPKIMTQDGHTSNTFVGSNIPFVGSYVSNQSQTTTTTSNIEYRDVGFNLVVTPTLGTNDIITLDINLESSQVLSTNFSVGNTNVSGIETSRATMTTRIHVPDRHFLILSGMLQDTKAHGKQGVPCLGGLPMIGALFAQNTVSDSKSNVIIFMKPYIIHSMDEFDRITAQEETLYKNDVVLPDVKETIDSGYEMIKNIE